MTSEHAYLNVPFVYPNGRRIIFTRTVVNFSTHHHKYTFYYHYYNSRKVHFCTADSFTELREREGLQLWFSSRCSGRVACA